MRIAALSFLALAMCSSPACAAAAKPNIVFILADDLGYGDLGCYGQTKIRTPNLDRMAAEGMRFTSFYAGCTVCAPSRCTLMTGKHLGHATVRDNMQRKPGAEGQHPMEPGTITVAQLLKRGGYATAIVGKWGSGCPRTTAARLTTASTIITAIFAREWHIRTIRPTSGATTSRSRCSVTRPSLRPAWCIAPGGRVYAHDLMAEDALRWVDAHRASRSFSIWPSRSLTFRSRCLKIPLQSIGGDGPRRR